MEKIVCQVVYKVVRRDWYKYESCREFSHNVGYSLKNKTIPELPHSKLFCFATVEQARNFAQMDDQILEGLGENPKRLLRSSSSSTYDEQFWLAKHRKKSVSGFNPMKTPKGTLVVDSFIPLREI